MFKVLDFAREALGSVAEVAAKVPFVENDTTMYDKIHQSISFVRNWEKDFKIEEN